MGFTLYSTEIQTSYTPLALPRTEPLITKEISFAFIQDFNGSDEHRQLQLLSNVYDTHQLWIFLSLNPTCYNCQTFIDELYQLTSNSLSVKQHLESRIIDLTKEDVDVLLDGRILLKDLEEKVIQAIHELGGYVFFKMHRSPKDAFETLCKEINGEWSTVWGLKCDEDPSVHFMKIQNINQLKVLLKTSNRIRDDLKEVSSQWNFVLRKWIDHMSNEYRCFVCNGKVNAVSAYGCNKDPIDNEKQVIEFINSKSFQDIILAIPYSHAVVDCSIDPTNYEVKIIEINPFSKRSSSAKFSWVIDKYTLYYHYDTNGNVNVKL
ncbi:unnamed protein product [Didymodactylos carnosus]|uniref:Cell division cycle protein 123 homolog n=1 Tax=Didymodactylos carnosus TaxID=1234261 RepID=A0A814VNI0_9BILA|nr:unnamed protein product [Didymodactylos carnosus]CAF3957283.1 unnamed protein product [Didymodactylos carnosus]